MFVEIDKNKFVNINRIIRLELVEFKDPNTHRNLGFGWELILSNGETIETKVFKTESEAMAWFLQLLAVSQG